jgi:hypothetical protein
MPITKLKPAAKRDVCPACDVAWILHPGLINICHRHQVALNCLERIASGKRNILERRLAVATLSLLKHCQ